MSTETENVIIYVETERVFCDGGDGALGHPGVYFNIGSNNENLCPYCNRRFAVRNVQGSNVPLGENN